MVMQYVYVYLEHTLEIQKNPNSKTEHTNKIENERINHEITSKLIWLAVCVLLT